MPLTLFHQPDISRGFAQRQHDLIAGHGKSEQAGVLNPDPQPGLMEMLDREGISRRPLGSGLEALRPDAMKTVARGGEVEQFAVRRPARLAVQGLAISCQLSVISFHLPGRRRMAMPVFAIEEHNHRCDRNNTQRCEHHQDFTRFMKVTLASG